MATVTVSPRPTSQRHTGQPRSEYVDVASAGFVPGRCGREGAWAALAKAPGHRPQLYGSPYPPAMRAVQITCFGGPEVLDVVDVPDPTQDQVSSSTR